MCSLLHEIRWFILNVVSHFTLTSPSQGYQKPTRAYSHRQFVIAESKLPTIGLSQDKPALGTIAYTVFPHRLDNHDVYFSGE